MRRFIVAAVSIAALAVPAVSMANASATTPAPGGAVGTTQGNAKNSTTQYKTTYTDPYAGTVSCSGVHKSGTNYGQASPTAVGGQDTWTCTSVNGTPLSDPASGFSGDVYWTSDYFNLLGKASPVVNAHITMSADGTSETGVASYPAAT